MPKGGKHIHCIGIGGIGVSALARLYRSRGFRVNGSDLARSDITDTLKKEGIRVFIGHRKSNLAPSVTKVVYSAAVRPDNPELREAKRRGIPARSYAEAVGTLTREFTTIAVAGAHGKSTTTALIALILMRARRNPTVIVGTNLRELKGSNSHLGRSRFFVLEADEYRNSFLNYTPAIAVITNIDREHLDFYKNVRTIENAFLKFLQNLRASGTAVLNRDDPRLRRAGARLRRVRRDVRIIWFSLLDPEAKKIRKILRIPGRHNVANALAARTVGKILKIPERTIRTALRSYRGSWRRFDYQGTFSGAKVYADYAHHPTEIKATLQAAREKFPRSRIWCVFQPHHYERTRDLFPEFTRAFDGCDEVVLLDIYEVAGREKHRRARGVSSEALAAAIARRGVSARYLAHPARLAPFLRARLKRGDVVLMMGAGTIWEMTKNLMRQQRQQRGQRLQR